jgi:AcrR family transcriptional regulator
VTSEVVRPYRGRSAEDRRAERRARLKEAGLDVIGDAGVAAVTVEEVCARAGLTKRYFYESFADRDALFAELGDDFFEAVRTEMLAELAGAAGGVRARADTIARVLIGFLGRDARRARLYVEAPGQATLRARRDQAYRTFTRLLVDTFPGAPGDDPRTREMTALLIVAGTTETATTWLTGGLDLPRDLLVAELAGVIERLLA